MQNSILIFIFIHKTFCNLISKKNKKGLSNGWIVYPTYDLADEFSKYPGKILPIKGDVRDHKDVQNVIDISIKKFGKIDALVNNAAGNFISPTERLTPKAFDVIVDIVLKGTYNYSLLIGKHWINTKHPGVILNIVTTYAWTGSAFVAPSAAAKGGVLALTRSLASEWIKYNIRCTFKMVCANT